MPITQHLQSVADRTAMNATREMLSTMPKIAIRPEGRPSFEIMMEQTQLPETISVEPGELAGISGLWCRPTRPARNAAILYLHGGGFVVGSARSHRGLAGLISAAAGVDVFVVDYALAPEYPFPTAIEQLLRVYDALLGRGCSRIVIAGDSAGGGLALALSSLVCARSGVRPVGVIALSPWTDLTMGGNSMVDRALHDPLLDRQSLADVARLYLSGADPHDPRASALFSTLANLPPVMIHVGQDEVLLDDSIRYGREVERAGGSADVHVWEGMIHVFVASATMLEAARAALVLIGQFVSARINDN